MDAREADVVIVGGGPAGLSAARTAAQAGARVQLLERGAGFGVPVRTSGASSIQHLRRLGVSDAFWQPVERLEVWGPSQRAAFDYRRPLACILDVRALYQGLARLAAEAGATLRLKALAIRFDAGSEGVEVGLRDGSLVRAQLAVDASGHGRTLARLAGVGGPVVRSGTGAEYDFYAPAFPETLAILAIGSVWAPCGYAWAFTYGSGRVRAGVGIIHPDFEGNPADFLDRFVASVPGLADAQPIEAHTGVIPAEPLVDRLVAPRLLVAGDSAAQASPLAGEGIRFAMEAGLLAGSAAATAVVSGACDEASLRQAYEKPWRRRRGRSMRVAWRLNQSFSAHDDATWDRRVKDLAALAPEVVARGLLTDFSPSLFAAVLKSGLRHPGLTASGLARLARKAV
jgi:digeranylgeranylglycerophospholipid reductase